LKGITPHLDFQVLGSPYWGTYFVFLGCLLLFIFSI
jgi:hypothetical protein